MLAKSLLAWYFRCGRPEARAALREKFLGRIVFVDSTLEENGARAAQLAIRKADWEAPCILIMSGMHRQESFQNAMSRAGCN